MMKSFLKGFVYAGAGILRVLQERNMRVHICIAGYMFYFLCLKDFFALTKTQAALLCVMCAVVLSLECVNTAVESVVDLVTTQKHPMAKKAKDAAAGAVLTAAVFSVAVGIILLWQPQAFKAMYCYYTAHPVRLTILLLSIAASFCAVFGIKSKQKRAE
ncbi:MAG: diacylglycerol kinase family protein [Clostridiales bacterium]|nr:diacylglycerol kinase family protein [Clostridiales bacterium]